MAAATALGTPSSWRSHSSWSAASTAARSVANCPATASAVELAKLERAIGALDEHADLGLGALERLGRRAQSLDAFLEQGERTIERHILAAKLGDDRLDAGEIFFVRHGQRSGGGAASTVVRSVRASTRPSRRRSRNARPRSKCAALVSACPLSSVASA